MLGQPVTSNRRKMNKGQLIDSLADRTGFPRPQAAAIVNAIFGVDSGIITEELSRGGTVVLTGFGRFATRQRAARTGVDPRTREKITIPARRACTFAPRKGLRSSMKDIVGG